jgi:flagellar hook-basal body complex protein FliE
MAIESIFASPVNAYQKAASLKGEGMTDGVVAGGDFADMLASYANDAVDAIKKGEQATQLAAQGKADITDVVMAVSSAEMTLQTIVSVRDKVIGAYQDIMRMPI